MMEEENGRSIGYIVLLSMGIGVALGFMISNIFVGSDQTRKDIVCEGNETVWRHAYSEIQPSIIENLSRYDVHDDTQADWVKIKVEDLNATGTVTYNRETTCR